VVPFESIAQALQWCAAQGGTRMSLLVMILGHQRRLLYTPVGIFTL